MKLPPKPGDPRSPRIGPVVSNRSGTHGEAARLLPGAKAKFDAGAYEEAREISRRVLDLDPGSADAYHMLAAIAYVGKDFPEAERLFAAAVERNRRSPHLRFHLGNAQRARENHEAAAATYRKALQLDPGMSDARLGLGAALRALNRAEESVMHLRRYVEVKPRDVNGHHELGLAYRDLGKLDVALRHLREVLNLEPGHAAARINLARVLLLAENFEEGWRAWLRSVASIPLPDPAHGAAAFHDKTVVIYGTEGVGDEIMFASCVPELARHATAVTLHCERRLKPLFARSFPGVRVFAMDKEGARRTIGWVTPNEFHMLASFLPAYFAPDPSRGPRGPFLVPDPAQVAEWRRRFDALGPGLKVGVSWRGGVEAINRSRRSIPLPQWTPVLTVPGIHFVNLQYGSNDTEIAPIQDRTGVPIHGWGDADPLTDLDFFAAQVAALDQVVSVDNTTVHLAGALGTPVWALVPFVPDWRWTMAGSRSCWYSLVRLVRQNKPGYWGSVMQEVRSLLEKKRAPG